jgi:hypothetical protein
MILPSPRKKKMSCLPEVVLLLFEPKPPKVLCWLEPKPPKPEPPLPNDMSGLSSASARKTIQLEMQIWAKWGYRACDLVGVGAR